MNDSLILKTASGKLDSDCFIRLFEEIIFSFTVYQRKNIICDFREAQFNPESMGELIHIATEMTKYRLVLTGKIAHVASDAGSQARIAMNLAKALALKGFNYKIFIDMEEARQWVVG